MLVNKIQFINTGLGVDRHRFSAYWLRSKCSICSYQLNIWYVAYMATSILNWFLKLGEVSGACSTFATGWPGIAVPPGTAQKIIDQKESNDVWWWCRASELSDGDCRLHRHNTMTRRMTEPPVANNNATGRSWYVSSSAIAHKRFTFLSTGWNCQN